MILQDFLGSYRESYKILQDPIQDHKIFGRIFYQENLCSLNIFLRAMLEIHQHSYSLLREEKILQKGDNNQI